MISDKLKKYGGNLSIYFGASIVPMTINLATNPLVASNMSPNDYAISGYYSSFAQLISPIIVFYLIHYYIKEFFKRNEKGRQKLFAIIAKSLIWFSGTVSMVCFVGLLIYENFYNPTLSFPILPYLALMVFALPLTGLYSLQQAKYRMEKKAKSFFRLSFFNSIVSTALLLLFVVVFKWGALGKLLSPLLGNLIIFIYLSFRFADVWRIKTKISDFVPIFKFCLPLALGSMLEYFTHGYSTTYLESIGCTTEYGIYIVGNSIASYLTVFSTAISNTFQPDLYENITQRNWIKYAKFCILQICLISMIVIVFIILAPYIISILTAGRYVASTPYAQIISISALTSSIYFITNNFSIATNHSKLPFCTSLVGSAFIVGVMPYIVSSLSFYGGAWMTVISFIGFALINIIFLFISQSFNWGKC